MRKFINTMLAGLLTLSMVAGVSAQTTGNATIAVGINNAGTRTVMIQQAPNFGTVPYKFDSQVAAPGAGAGDLIIKATVNTGDNLGWNVTLSGTDFIAGTFPVGNMVLGSGSVTDVAPGTAGNITTTAGAVTPGATKVISASANYSSNGAYTVTFTGNQLTVPGNTLVGSYTSTLTVAITQGP